MVGEDEFLQLAKEFFLPHCDVASGNHHSRPHHPDHRHIVFLLRMSMTILIFDNII